MKNTHHSEQKSNGILRINRRFSQGRSCREMLKALVAGHQNVR